MHFSRVPIGNLHSHHQRNRAPFSPRPVLHFWFLHFVRMALWTDVKWYLFVVLICISHLFGWPNIFSWIYSGKIHTPFLANCILSEAQPLIMCFKGESNLPLEIPFLQFYLAYKSFSMTYLKIFFDDRYHLQPCRFVNCSAPELHFSSCFFGNWPQNSRIASSPILVPGASWAFGQFLFLIGN